MYITCNFGGIPWYLPFPNRLQDVRLGAIMAGFHLHREVWKHLGIPPGLVIFWAPRFILLGDGSSCLVPPVNIKINSLDLWMFIP